MIKLLTFHICASYQVQQHEVASHGMNECGAYKFEYVKDSSLDEVQAFRHHPCPLVGTCHHGSVPSDLKSCKRKGSLILECKSVDSRDRKSTRLNSSHV